MEKNKKYITITEGTDFRTVAKLMTEKGFPMNHATARNFLMSTISKFLKLFGEEIKINLTEKQLKELTNSNEIHEILSNVLYLEIEDENTKK